MKVFVPIAKFDEGSRNVYGYATTEALDAHGEVVTRAAIEAALPGYMRFANIREMHQLSAVGVAQEADLDEKGLYLKAKVIDDDAWAKVREGVYKGFSIGGRITARDPNDATLITGVELNEISLVDRPANPEATIDVFKIWGEGSLGKAGARNSKADLDRIQHVHDTAVDLGANCPGATANDASDDDAGDDMALMAGGMDRGAVLQKVARVTARMAELARTVEAQGRLLRRLADEPAAPKYLHARVVDKEDDAIAPASDDAPKTVLDAIKKAHRNPIRLTIG